MKKRMFYFFAVALVAIASVAPIPQAKADPCNGCWWNQVDQDCCENGSMCCGMCGGGFQLV